LYLIIKIFITIPWFHPAYKAGGPVQSIANLVNQYVHPAVKFNIYCGNTDLDGSVLKGVAFDQWVKYNEQTQVWYTSNQQVKTMQQLVYKLRPDVIFIVGIFETHFTMTPLLFCKAPRKIISVRGMLHPGALSQKAFKKKVWLLAWKLLGIHRRYQFHATDKQEATFIQSTFGDEAKIFVAGNYPRIFCFQQVEKKTGYLKLTSIALISPMKNIALVLQALQHCKNRISYDIYGPVKDKSYWEECLRSIATLPANISVRYMGAILPSKTETVLKENEVFVLPSKSENFGHALFEALSAGKPVITSNFTPFNELENNKAGKNVSLDNVDDITNAIDFFAGMDSSSFAQWNMGASEYAKKQVDLNLLNAQYNNLFA
jgi:glycosyltransferase involved in cell wall biosynthesis